MKIITDYLPPALIRKITGLFYGWHGNYNSWEDAKKHSIGYDTDLIFNKVKDALLKVKNGEALYERDSVIFNKIQYSFPLLSALLWVALRNNGNLNLIDFGGSLGSSWYQNRFFLKDLKKVNWNIVEQKHFVECGKKYFENDILKFYNSIDDCYSNQHPDTLLLTSVLQYLETPYQFLESVFKRNFSYIIIDRTPMIKGGKDRITIQKVPSHIYKATYPCWFFGEEKFVRFFSKNYELVADSISTDIANIRSEFKGYVFVKKK